ARGGLAGGDGVPDDLEHRHAELEIRAPGKVDPARRDCHFRAGLRRPADGPLVDAERDLPGLSGVHACRDGELRQGQAATRRGAGVASTGTGRDGRRAARTVATGRMRTTRSWWIVTPRLSVVAASCRRKSDAAAIPLAREAAIVTTARNVVARRSGIRSAASISVNLISCLAAERRQPAACGKST